MPIRGLKSVIRESLFVIRYPLSVNGKPFAPTAQLVTARSASHIIRSPVTDYWSPHRRRPGLPSLISHLSSLVTRHSSLRQRRSSLPREAHPRAKSAKSINASATDANTPRTGSSSMVQKVLRGDRRQSIYCARQSPPDKRSSAPGVFPPSQ